MQANGIALQTEDPSFKQTIDQKTLTELPLNGRQVTSLITLSGGSANANEDTTCREARRFTVRWLFPSAGGHGQRNRLSLDGGDHNDYMTNVNLPISLPRCGQPIQRGNLGAGSTERICIREDW